MIQSKYLNHGHPARTISSAPHGSEPSVRRYKRKDLKQEKERHHDQTVQEAAHPVLLRIRSFEPLCIQPLQRRRIRQAREQQPEIVGVKCVQTTHRLRTVNTPLTIDWPSESTDGLFLFRLKPRRQECRKPKCSSGDSAHLQHQCLVGGNEEQEFGSIPTSFKYNPSAGAADGYNRLLPFVLWCTRSPYNEA